MKTLKNTKSISTVVLALSSLAFASHAGAESIYRILYTKHTEPAPGLYQSNPLTLDMRDVVSTIGIPAVQRPLTANVRFPHTSQFWHIPDPGKVGHIWNEFSGKCLWTNGKPGRAVYLWSCNNDPSVMWEPHYYTQNGREYVWFRNPASGLVLDINQSSKNDGAPLVVWYPTGRDNQSFGNINCGNSFGQLRFNLSC